MVNRFIIIALLIYRLVQLLVGTIRLYETVLVSGDHQIVQRATVRHRWFSTTPQWVISWFCRHSLFMYLDGCAQVTTGNGRMETHIFILTRGDRSVDPTFDFVLQHEIGHALTTPIIIKSCPERRSLIREVFADRYAAAQLGTDRIQSSLQLALQRLQHDTWLSRRLTSPARKEQIARELRQRMLQLAKTTDREFATMRKLAAYVASE